jgi:hypothetical protein
MGRRCAIAVVCLLSAACVTLTPAGAHVSVYRGQLDGRPEDRRMPAGCSLLGASRPTSMPELDLYGQKDPFREERNAAGREGANALLVLSRMTISRHNTECPGSSPITDCPPDFGAWYRVVVERYACSDAALRDLASRARAGDPTLPH